MASGASREVAVSGDAVRTSSTDLIESVTRRIQWLTWLVLSSSCEKSGIRRRERSNNWTRRLPRSTATHTEDELEQGARFQQEEGRGSRLRSERVGLGCGRAAGKSRT